MENTLRALVLLALVKGSTQACDTDKASECLKSFGEVPDTRGLVTLNESSLDKKCSALQILHGCLGDDLDSCKAQGELTIALSMLDGLKYICDNSDAKQEYLSSRECVSNPAVSGAVTDCIAPLNEMNVTSAGQACSEFVKASTCAWEAINETCGVEAANVHFQISKIGNKVFYNPFNCQLVLPGSAQACDTDKASQCLTSFGEVPDTRGLVTLNQSALDKKCSALQTLHGCLGDDLDSCKAQGGTTEIGIALSMLDGLKYICENNDAKQKYLSSRECVIKPAVSEAVTQCIAPLNELNVTSPVQVCSEFVKAFTCIWEAINTTCGVEAANVHFQISKIGNKVFYTALNCQIKQPSNGNGAENRAACLSGPWIVAPLALLLVFI